MRTIENDIPEIFLELAKEGFALGFEKVQIGFYTMGWELRSPHEWALWLTKRESNSEAREHLVVSMQRGDNEATAYIGVPPGGSYEDTVYWGPDEIRAWMVEPLESEGEYSHSWSPIQDPALQEKFLAQWPLFEEGVRSGWVMERRANWRELASLRRTMEKFGKEPPAEDELPVLGLSWNTTNSFYNLEGHADHRDTGAELSITGFSVLYDGEEEQFFRHGDGEDPRPVRLSREEVEELLGTNHRWFIRVADHDDEQEEWFHFPEALHDPELTISTPIHRPQEETMATANGTETGARRALIVVDVQFDFVEGGALAVAGGTAVAERIAAELLTEDSPYDLIVTTQDWHIDPGAHFSDAPDFVNSWPRHCEAETHGAEILPVIRAALAELSVEQGAILKGQYEDAYSGFMGATATGEKLADFLRSRDIDRVDVVGLAEDFCVASSAIDSAREGFDTRVLRDYTAGIIPEKIEALISTDFPREGVSVA